MSLREPNTFEEAVYAGDIGLVGMDGSGNDWEFSQNLGSAAMHDVIEDESTKGDQQ